MSYDSRCYDLAEAFLVDWPTFNNEQRRDQLAQHIQTTIENWIEYEESASNSSLTPPERKP